MEREILLIGSGNMAVAILQGLYRNRRVTVVARRQEACKNIEAEFGDKVGTLVLEEGVDISGKVVLMAVKPHALASVSQKLQGRAYAHLSVLAGVPLELLRTHVEAEYTVRAMPNLAARFGKSMTTLCGDEGFKEEAMALCEAFGRALWLGSEKEIDIATAIAGSGPAYLALAAEALADGGVKAGLKRDDAQVLVRGLFDGMEDMLQMHPAVLKDAVMSPGGTTAAGYGALEEGNVRDGFIKAVEAAFLRAQQLAGKK